MLCSFALWFSVAFSAPPMWSSSLTHTLRMSSAFARLLHDPGGGSVFFYSDIDDIDDITCTRLRHSDDDEIGCVTCARCRRIGNYKIVCTAPMTRSMAHLRTLAESELVAAVGRITLRGNLEKFEHISCAGRLEPPRCSLTCLAQFTWNREMLDGIDCTGVAQDVMPNQLTQLPSFEALCSTSCAADAVSIRLRKVTSLRYDVSRGLVVIITTWKNAWQPQPNCRDIVEHDCKFIDDTLSAIQ